MNSRKVQNFMHDGFTLFTSVGWSEVDSCVEITYGDPEESYNSKSVENENTLPVMSKEEFYSLVSDVEFVMGWKREE